MENEQKPQITVETSIAAPVELVWRLWTSPEHIVNWNNASDDWHTPSAENDLSVGGRFTSTMAARDGSVSFDFGGTYTAVEDLKYLAYTIDDERNVSISFEETDGYTHVKETFEAEGTHPVEMQQAGWQAILDNFKRYVEASKS